jgi:hypothetical protein
LDVEGSVGKSGFNDTAHTLVVCAHGATVVLRRTLLPGQKITIRRGERTATAKIVGQVGIESGGHVYGICLLEPGRTFWGIAFPSPGDDAQAAARMVLRCADCSTREVRHLNEVELLVVESNRQLVSECKACARNTTWTAVDADLSGVVADAEASVVPAVATQQAPVHDGKDRRRHVRVKMRAAKACIMQPNLPDDIVDVLDVSRGGLRFTSLHEYQRGTWVQVAVPYTPGGANIFVSARIVRVQGVKGDNQRREYGLQYAAPNH